MSKNPTKIKPTAKKRTRKPSTKQTPPTRAQLLKKVEAQEVHIAKLNFRSTALAGQLKFAHGALDVSEIHRKKWKKRAKHYQSFYLTISRALAPKK